MSSINRPLDNPSNNPIMQNFSLAPSNQPAQRSPTEKKTDEIAKEPIKKQEITSSNNLEDRISLSSPEQQRILDLANEINSQKLSLDSLNNISLEDLDKLAPHLTYVSGSFNQLSDKQLQSFINRYSGPQKLDR